MDTILITGGSGLLGTIMVEFLLEKDYDVIATYVSDESGRKMQARYKDNAHFTCFKVDMTLPKDIDSLVKRLKEQNKLPHIVIHNARSIKTLKKDADGLIPFDAYELEHRIGVVSPYLLTKKLVLCKAPLKNIVFISSMYGIVSPHKLLYEDFESNVFESYCTTKAAQIQLTKVLATQLADKQIRVNCLSLGGIEGRADEKFKEKYAQLAPSGKMIPPQEIIGAIEFLISEKNKHLTGHNLIVDGGWTSW